MKLIGILVVFFIFFSYLPFEKNENCSEDNHCLDKGIACGYLFHCPFIFSGNINAISILPLTGKLIYALEVEKSEELVRLIFHPPEKISAT